MYRCDCDLNAELSYPYGEALNYFLLNSVNLENFTTHWFMNWVKIILKSVRDFFCHFGIIKWHFFDVTSLVYNYSFFQYDIMGHFKYSM